ncbi:MAG: hypothetical protein K2N48_12910 [Muribaculaceae bacterium]|nr:hypothetical protein [Muribaculaceae bacterium]
MRHVLLILFYIASGTCFGQEIINDIVAKTYAVPDSVAKSSYDLKETGSALLLNKPLPYGMNESVSRLDLNKHVFLDTIRPPKNMPEPGTAYIPLWRNGGLVAAGSMEVMPGLMKIDSGSFGFSQSIGNFSFYMGGLANKYGFFNGLHTQYGVNGNFQYLFSPKLSFNAFGTYYFGKPPMMSNGMFMQPAMMGFYKVSNFGGYLSYQFNETFGVDVGAQAVQNFGTERYRFEPIVTPTVKVGKVKLGLPVGQIFNGIIRSQAEQRRHR